MKSKLQKGKSTVLKLGSGFQVSKTLSEMVSPTRYDTFPSIHLQTTGCHLLHTESCKQTRHAPTSLQVLKSLTSTKEISEGWHAGVEKTIKLNNSLVGTTANPNLFLLCSYFHASTAQQYIAANDMFFSSTMYKNPRLRSPQCKKFEQVLRSPHWTQLLAKPQCHCFLEVCRSDLGTQQL